MPSTSPDDTRLLIMKIILTLGYSSMFGAQLLGLKSKKKMPVNFRRYNFYISSLSLNNFLEVISQDFSKTTVKSDLKMYYVLALRFSLIMNSFIDRFDSRLSRYLTILNILNISNEKYNLLPQEMYVK